MCIRHTNETQFHMNISLFNVYFINEFVFFPYARGRFTFDFQASASV